MLGLVDLIYVFAKLQTPYNVSKAGALRSVRPIRQDTHRLQPSSTWRQALLWSGQRMECA